MTDEELIARLRGANVYRGPDFSTPVADPIKVAAADRIEALRAPPALTANPVDASQTPDPVVNAPERSRP